MSKTSKFVEGDLVIFSGFSGKETPDGGENLKKGKSYEIKSFVDEDPSNEPFYNIKVDNPDYNPDKRRTKDNHPYLTVSVFEDEIKAAKSKKSKGKTKETAPASEEKKETAAQKKKRIAKEKAAEKKAKEEEKADKEVAKAKNKEEKELAKELKDLVILDEGEEDQDIVDLCQDADDLCELAKELADESAVSDYRLGGVLYHVRLTAAHKEAGDKYADKGGFGLWAEDMLGIKYRKAMYLTEIYATFNKHGIGSDVVAELGWTKCAEIAKVVDDKNVDKLLKIAGESTVRDLQDTIKSSYSGGKQTKELVKKMSFRFSLVEDAGVAVAELFEMAQTQLGLDHINEVFESIVVEWSTEHLEVSKVRKISNKLKKAKNAAAKEAKAKTAAGKAASTKSKGDEKKKTASKKKVVSKKKAATKRK